VATIRDPKISPLVRFEDKLRVGAALRWRETRITADGIELEGIDTQTGQVALVTVSPVNSGICPGCGHVDHFNAARCEAVRAFTKDDCNCRPFYGRFPTENRELDEPALPASMRDAK
jgi:hypothetical protein